MTRPKFSHNYVTGDQWNFCVHFHSGHINSGCQNPIPVRPVSSNTVQTYYRPTNKEQLISLFSLQ